MRRGTGIAAGWLMFAMGALAIGAAQAGEVEQIPVPVLPPDPVEPEAPPAHWEGDVALGYVRTSGNSNTTSFNGKTDLERKRGPWDNLFTADAFIGRTQGTTTDEKYDVGDRLTYNLDPIQYVFGEGDYNNDRFAGITERYSFFGGYGRHFLKTPTQTLDADLGAGVTHYEDRGEEHFQNRPIITAGGTYVWKITPTSTFKQTLRAEYSFKNLFVRPVSDLKLQVLGRLFVALDYELRYNTDVPADTAHTDQIFSVNLGYDFGKKKPCGC